jgi:hypothetical protein
MVKNILSYRNNFKKNKIASLAAVMGASFFYMTGALEAEEIGSAATEVVYFQWCPAGGPKEVYNLPKKEDQHRIFIYPGVKKEGPYPVVVGFHGQPKRGKAPGEYRFVREVPGIVESIVR